MTTTKQSVRNHNELNGYEMVTKVKRHLWRIACIGILAILVVAGASTYAGAVVFNTCGVENDYCAYWTATDNGTPSPWTFNTGTTASTSVGPAGPHSGSYYVYTEASSSAAGAEWYLTSPTVDATTYAPYINFWYAKYHNGTTTCELHVEVSTNGGSSWNTPDWTTTVDQGPTPASAAPSDYLNQNVDLSSYTGNILVRFRAASPGAFQCDTALDDIEIGGATRCSANAPSDLAAPTVLYNQVDLTWTYDGVNNDLGYEVWRDGVKISGANVLTGSYSDTTVSAGASYNYTVRGVASCGTSVDSNSVPVSTPSFTPGTTTGAISFPDAGPSSISVEVAFSGDDDTDGTLVLNYGTTNGGPYPFSAVVTRGAGVYTSTVSGLTKATPYYFQATFSDPDGVSGTNPVLGSQSTTDILLMHNSANLGTKYGDWGVAGGTYGEFTCATCHEPNPANGNIKRLRTNIQASGTISGRAVVANDADAYGANNTTHATSDKICEVCHSQPAVHKYNQGTAVAHYGNNCTSCHKHKTSFKPDASNCGLCHDTGLAGAPVITASNSHTDADGSGVTYTAGTCTDCHPGGTKGGIHNKSGDTNVVAIANNTDVGISYGHTVDDNGTPGVTSDDVVGFVLGGDATTGTSEAEMCWNCHMAQGVDGEFGTNTQTATGNSPYHYGTLDNGTTHNWIGATWRSSRSQFDYKAGTIQSTHTANPNLKFPGTGDTLTTNGQGGMTETPNDVRDIRCSYCHDVHELALATADTKAGKPYLRGTWMGNPYEEDGAPRDGAGNNVATASAGAYGNDNNWGSVPRGAVGMRYLGGFFIDQNNAVPMSVTATSVGTAASNPTSGWNLASSAGLCMLCHTKDSLGNTVTIDSLDWKTGEGLWVGTNGHSNAVIGGTGSARVNIYDARGGSTGNNPFAHYSGWATDPGRNNQGFRTNATGSMLTNGLPKVGTSGAVGGGTTRAYKYRTLTGGFEVISGDTNPVQVAGQATAQTQFHSFSCSKCHNPHASRLPKLMITNCLDTKHNTWDNQYPTVNTTNNVNVTLSNLTSAQNCHRRTGDDPDDTRDQRGHSGTGYSGAGWNNVTPW